jgi:hypothetical protein
MNLNTLTSKDVLDGACVILLGLCWLAVLFVLDKKVYKGRAGLTPGSAWLTTVITLLIAFGVWKVFHLLLARFIH